MCNTHLYQFNGKRNVLLVSRRKNPARNRLDQQKIAIARSVIVVTAPYRTSSHDASKRVRLKKRASSLNCGGESEYAYVYKKVFPVRISPELCRAARGLLGWSQQDLATRAQVARKTIADFELSQVTPHPRTLRDVVATFQAAGVEFLPPEDNITRGGVRMKWINPDIHV